MIGSGRWESKTYPGTKTLSASEYLTNKGVNPQREVVEGRTPQLSWALIASALAGSGVCSCASTMRLVPSRRADRMVFSLRLTFSTTAPMDFLPFLVVISARSPATEGRLEVTRLRDSG